VILTLPSGKMGLNNKGYNEISVAQIIQEEMLKLSTFNIRRTVSQSENKN